MSESLKAGYLSRDRAIYNHITNLEEVQGKAKPTKSFLRQEVVITDGLTEYEFDFKEQTGGVNLPQRLIKYNDKFWVTRIGMFLGKELVTKKPAMRLCTYPSATEFPNGVAPNNFTAANLYAFYNGLLYSKTDKSIVFDGIQTLNFLKVPNKQEGEVAGVKETERIAKEDFYDIEPIFTLDGQNNNSLFVKIPPNQGLPLQSPDANYVHKLILILDGYYGLGHSKSK